MIIAITGCIGSGKSYIANLIHTQFGYEIFSSDVIANNSYNDENVKAMLDQQFACIVDGKVDKSIIKNKLNEQTISKLNLIIHPYVKNEILKIKENFKDDIAFIEVPLLFESKMEDLFDKTLVISASDELRHKRIKKRNPQTYQDMIKLEQFQMSNLEKVKRADFVLESSDDDSKNLNQLTKIVNLIIKK